MFNVVPSNQTLVLKLLTDIILHNETEPIQQKMPNNVHSCHEKKRKKQCEQVSCEKQYMCMNYSLCINILQVHWRCKNRVHSEVHCCVHHQAKLQLLFQYPCFDLDGDQQERIWIITGALVWLQRGNQKTCQFSFCSGTNCFSTITTVT